MCVSWQYTAAAAISRFVGEGGLLGQLLSGSEGSDIATLR